MYDFYRVGRQDCQDLGDGLVTDIEHAVYMAAWDVNCWYSE